MKKKLKTLMSIFGASFSFIDPSLQKFTEKASILKELFVHTKVEGKFDLETTLENNQSQFLEKKTALNKTKVFLIVNAQKDNNKKSEKNTLLLVGAKDQVNSFSRLKKLRKKHIIQKAFHTWTKQGKRDLQAFNRSLEDSELTSSVVINQVIRRKYNNAYIYSGFKTYAPIAEHFRGASYLTRQKASNKSISPVFLEENSAKNFLIQNLQYLKSTMNKHEDILDGKEKISKEFSIKLKNKKTMPQELKNIDNVKIVSLGLGDFIEYYSTASNQEGPEKVDFLFFPDLETLRKTRNKKIRMKGFKTYQQQLYGYSPSQNKKE